MCFCLPFMPHKATAGRGLGGLKGGALPEMVALPNPTHTHPRFVLCNDGKEKVGLDVILFCWVT